MQKMVIMKLLHNAVREAVYPTVRRCWSVEVQDGHARRGKLQSYMSRFSRRCDQFVVKKWRFIMRFDSEVEHLRVDSMIRRNIRSSYVAESIKLWRHTTKLYKEYKRIVMRYEHCKGHSQQQ